MERKSIPLPVLKKDGVIFRALNGICRNVSYNQTSDKYTGRKSVRNLGQNSFRKMDCICNILSQLLQLYICHLDIYNFNICSYGYIFIRKKLSRAYFCQDCAKSYDPIMENKNSWQRTMSFIDYTIHKWTHGQELTPTPNTRSLCNRLAFLQPYKGATLFLTDSVVRDCYSEFWGVSKLRIENKRFSQEARLCI